MDQNTGIILAAGIGAASVLGGSLITMLLQFNLEKRKWLRKRDDAQRKDLMVAVERFNTKIAAAIHAMCWLTWIAMEVSFRLNQAKIEQYEKEINPLLSEITALRITIMAIDEGAGIEVIDLANEVYSMDAAVAKAGFLFDSDASKCVTELSNLYNKIVILENEVPARAATIMKKERSRIKEGGFKKRMRTIYPYFSNRSR